MFRLEKAEKVLRICTAKNLSKKADQMVVMVVVVDTFFWWETKVFGHYFTSNLQDMSKPDMAAMGEVIEVQAPMAKTNLSKYR
jgi:hypothetical protein